MEICGSLLDGNGFSRDTVIVADGTITGAGVVLAQRLEQMAVPGGVVMQGAVHEAIPERYPFAYEYLGEHPVKGFDDPVRAFNVTLADNREIPSPRDIEHKKSSAIFRHYILGIMAIAFIVAFVAVTLITPGNS